MPKGKNGLPPLDSVVTEIRKDIKRQRRKEEKWSKNEERERITEQTRQKASERAMYAMREDCYFSEDDDNDPTKPKFRDELDRIMKVDEAELLAASKPKFTDDDPVSYEYYFGDKRVKQDLAVKQMLEKYREENNKLNSSMKQPIKRSKSEAKTRKEVQNAYNNDYEEGDFMNEIMRQIAEEENDHFDENGEYEITSAEVVTNRDVGGELRIEKSKRYHTPQPCADDDNDPYGHSPSAAKLVRASTVKAGSIRNIAHGAAVAEERVASPLLKPKLQIMHSKSSIQLSKRKNTHKNPLNRLNVSLPTEEELHGTSENGVAPVAPFVSNSVPIQHIPPKGKKVEDLWVQKQKQETLKRSFMYNARYDIERIIEKRRVHRRLYTAPKKPNQDKKNLFNELMPTWEYWDEYKMKFKDDYKARSLKESYMNRVRAKKRIELALDPECTPNEQEFYNQISAQVARDKKRKKEVGKLPKITILCKNKGFDSVIREADSDEEHSISEEEEVETYSVTTDDIKKFTLERMEDSLEEQRALVTPIIEASQNAEKLAQMKVLEKYGSVRKAKVAKRLTNIQY